MEAVVFVHFRLDLYFIRTYLRPDHLNYVLTDKTLELKEDILFHGFTWNNFVISNFFLVTY